MRVTEKLVGGLAVLVLGACGARGAATARPQPAGLTSTVRTTPPEAATPSTAPATTTTATPTNALADSLDAARAAYDAYWVMYTRVNDPPNDGDPTIVALSTGPAFDALLDIIHANIVTGRYFSLPANSISSHRVTGTASGGLARLTDCFVDDGLVVDRTSGSVVNDAIVTDVVHVEMVVEDGRWKVFGYQFVSRQPGVTGCASA